MQEKIRPMLLQIYLNSYHERSLQWSLHLVVQLGCLVVRKWEQSSEAPVPKLFAFFYTVAKQIILWGLSFPFTQEGMLLFAPSLPLLNMFTT